MAEPLGFIPEWLGNASAADRFSCQRSPVPMGHADRIPRQHEGAPDSILGLSARGLAAPSNWPHGGWPAINSAATLQPDARHLARGDRAAADMAEHAGLCAQLLSLRYRSE